MGNKQVEAQGIHEIQLVTFTLGEEEFAVDILAVQEIIRMAEITKVPNAPEFVEGIINLRGVVIPIMDLRKRFNITQTTVDNQTRIIVVRLGAKTVGLIVDQVSEVLRISSEYIEDAPDIVKSSVNADIIKGVGKLGDRLLTLLEMSALLGHDEMNELDAHTAEAA